jgi:hypothetical protein
MPKQQRQGEVEVRPDLFLPRHTGDVVRLVAALAVLLVSIKLLNGNHIDELEIDAFRLVNDLPGVLYRPVWLVMQLGNVLVVPVVAGLAALTRRFRLAVNLAVAGLAATSWPGWSRAWSIGVGRRSTCPMSTSTGRPRAGSAISRAMPRWRWPWRRWPAPT